MTQRRSTNFSHTRITIEVVLNSQIHIISIKLFPVDSIIAETNSMRRWSRLSLDWPPHRQLWIGSTWLWSGWRKTTTNDCKTSSALIIDPKASGSTRMNITCNEMICIAYRGGRIWENGAKRQILVTVRKIQLHANDILQQIDLNLRRKYFVGAIKLL